MFELLRHAQTNLASPELGKRLQALNLRSYTDLRRLGVLEFWRLHLPYSNDYVFAAIIFSPATVTNIHFKDVSTEQLRGEPIRLPNGASRFGLSRGCADTLIYGGVNSMILLEQLNREDIASIRGMTPGYAGEIREALLRYRTEKYSRRRNS